MGGTGIGGGPSVGVVFLVAFRKQQVVRERRGGTTPPECRVQSGFRSLGGAVVVRERREGGVERRGEEVGKGRGVSLRRVEGGAVMH